MRPLSKLNKGEFAFIVDVSCGVTCLEVFNNGVFPGDEIFVLENNPQNHEMVISNHYSAFTITKKKAEVIMTHLVSYEFNLN